MCAAVTGVFAGKLFRVTRKSAVAAVIAPPASLVKLNVIVAFPFPPASAFVMAGTSFDGNRVAKNLTWLAFDEAVGVFDPQPVTNRNTAPSVSKRFIVFLLRCQ